MTFIKNIFLRAPLFGIALLLASCASQTPEETPAAIPSTPTIAQVTATPETTCTTISVEPTPVFNSSLVTVTADDLILGLESAPVTLIQYCDLQSIDCYALTIMTKQLLVNHPQDVRVVVRPIPLLELEGFENSKIAVQAVIAADLQGKYLEMFNLLFEKYAEWANLKPSSAFEGWLKKQVPALGLEASRFSADLKSADTVNQMTEWYNTAKANGVAPPYPLVLINGIPVNVGLLNYEYLDSTVSLIALGARQFTECPPFTVDPGKQYIATLHLEKGDIVIQLFPAEAPLAVNSFVFLARRGWFDNVTFHRVIPGFVAQAGDPSGTGQGGPGYFFKNEISNLKFDRPGRVGMANSGPDTNGSQFFITYAPQPHLDGGYTIFGQVLRGMEVVESLTPRDPQSVVGLPPGDKILGVEIEEK